MEIKEGEFWRFVDKTDGENISVRVRTNGLTRNCWNVKVVAPTNWSTKKWTISNIVNDCCVTSSWTKVESNHCLKCERKNPCRALELICYGCRL